MEGEIKLMPLHSAEYRHTFFYLFCAVHIWGTKLLTKISYLISIYFLLHEHVRVKSEQIWVNNLFQTYFFLYLLLHLFINLTQSFGT